MACGADSSSVPKPIVRSSSITAMQTKTAQVRTPISSPVCWRDGVAPSRKPVLRSCEVSPAIEAAMATTQPTVSAATLPTSPVQPRTRKMAEVASSVAMVMPLVGFEVTPTRPTMRDETVTKKNAATATSTAARARPPTWGRLLKTWGTKAMTRTSTPTPAPISVSGRSRWVRSPASPPAPSRARSWRAPTRKLSIIVGIERIRVIRPPVATAPAPM